MCLNLDMAIAPIIDMRSYMGADLAGVFMYDFPDQIIYLGVSYPAIIKDRTIDELDEFGGPIRINVLEIHIQTSNLESVIQGQLFKAKGENKEIKSSQLSEDGNELIIYARTS